MVTVRDVAARAGVSASTVSRALSAPGMVNDATRRLVLAAAQELDYRPNLSARGLRVGRTATLGLVVPDLENPFFAAVTKGVQARARASGYAVFIADSDEDLAQETELVGHLAAQVDGLLLVSPRSGGPELVRAAAGRPLVLLNRRLDGFASAVMDDADGMAQVVRHLRALGHTEIAYAGGPALSWSSEQRRHGLLEAARTVPELSVVELGSFAPTFSGGHAAADPAVASGATAVIAYNDLVALGVMDRLRQRGLTVPADLSVVGFDDAPVATLVSPGLTTVRSPLAGLGRAGVDRLVEELATVAGGSPSSGTTTTQDRPGPLPVELIIRGSTAEPRRA